MPKTSLPKTKGPNCLEVYRALVPRHNEPVIDAYGNLARLIGYGEDESDCYLILHSPERGVVWHTAVGGYTFLTSLKGQGVIHSSSGENWNDLWRLSEDLKRRGVPETDEFQVILEEEGGK